MPRKTDEAAEAVEVAAQPASVPVVVKEADPDPFAGWVLVRALEPLVGAGRLVERGEEYLQPPEAAAFMTAKGWVEIVE